MLAENKRCRIDFELIYLIRTGDKLYQIDKNVKCSKEKERRDLSAFGRLPRNEVAHNDKILRTLDHDLSSAFITNKR